MALEFDGSTQYIQVAHNALFNFTNNFSIVFWFKATNTTQTDTYIIQKGSNRWSIIWEFVDNAVEFYTGSYTGTNPRTGSQLTINDTNWHHIVYAYNGTTWAGYLDGVQVFSVSRTFTLYTDTDNLYFGRADIDAAYVAGQLFDIRLYNRALTANEIAEIYHRRGADKVWQGLVGWWRMDSYERGTTTLIDELNLATGWTCHSCTVSNNSINQDGSAGSLNITKTVGTDVYAQKTITTTNLLNKWIGFWVYIKDSATLAKLDDIQVFLMDSTGGVWGIYHFFYDLKVGWQRLECDVAGMLTSAGTPNRTQVGLIRIDTDCNVSETTWAEGDVIVDYFYSFSPIAMDLSGNGNNGNIIGGKLQGSPHRLRRGVIIT